MELRVIVSGNASEVRYGGQAMRRTGEREWRLALLDKPDLDRLRFKRPFAARAVAR